MDSNEHSQPIPKEFHSFSLKGPFTTCIECHCDLQDKEYFIEKAVRTYPGFKAVDVIFELAVCVDCAEELRKSLSEESMKNLNAFMQKNVRTGARMNVMQTFPDEPEQWTAACLVSGEKKNQISEYQIYAQCRGNQLIMETMPYMISGSVLDKMTEVLSNETLGEMDKFIGKHFGPPSLEKDLPQRRTILV
jgi:hypothetical protein